MKKIKFKLLGLSYSQSQIGSYVVVLSEVKGDRKVPIIIKPNEAQYIAFKMENIKPPRPMTQDLFKSMTEALAADVVEVVIHEVIEGIFYSKIILSNLLDSFEIDCTVGDAISMSSLYECPIYITSSVVSQVGIYMGDDGEVSKEQMDKNRNREEEKPQMSIENLEKMMQKAVENEEYEIATQLRDRINELKIHSKNN
jgi:bifunctional DNase/RNase